MRSQIYCWILFLLFFLPSAAFSETLSVKPARINLRSGPGEKYPVKCVYSRGFPLKTLKSEGEWVQVSDFERETGWVLRRLLSPSRHGIVSVFKNQNKRINIRSGPGTNYKIVGQAYYGVIFSLTDKKGEWTKIQHSSGLTGWIQENFIWGE